MAACPLAVWPIAESPSGELHRDSDHRSSATLSDDLLVEMARCGDSNAFEQLMKRHERFCLSKAFSILRNFSDAEDEVQSAWFQVWTRLHQYQCQGNFRAWVTRVILNQCLMRRRKAGFKPLTSVDEVFHSGGSFRLELIDQSTLPEQAAVDAEFQRMINEQIAAVPPLLRNVLVMRELHQLEFGDIAEDLGISVPAVKSRLMRGRAELKKRLEIHSFENTFSTPSPSFDRSRVAYVRES